MKHIATIGLCLAALAAAPAARGDFDADLWREFAPVESPAEASGAGLVEVSLSPEILDGSRPDRADIRVVRVPAVETPCLLHRTRSRTQTVNLTARLHNRGYLSGQSASVTADFGKRMMKNRVAVVTGGNNFRRKVLLEGSDDGTNWQTIRKGAFLFRVGGNGGSAYNKDVVEFPDNNQRYLRVTVLNGADDPEKVEISSVRAWRSVTIPARTEPVPLAGTQVRRDGRKTVLEFDFGYRHLPIETLSLTFRDANFFRRIEVLGRQEKERVVRHRVEDGPPVERKVEVPWRRISSGAIFRYSGEEGNESSLSVKLAGADTRHLRVVVFNQDDAPLTFVTARASRFLELLRFPCQPGATWRVYFGNAKARAPEYDLRHYAGRLEKKGLVAARPGAAQANPAFGRRKADLPWWERNSLLVWLALVAGVAVVGWMILQQVRSGNAGDQ